MNMILKMPTMMASPTSPTRTPEMQQLIERAESGDQTAQEPLRRLLNDVPELWEHYGDLAAWAERSWLDLVADNNLLLRTSLEQKLAALREELDDPDDQPVVKLLVRRVVTSWLQVSYGDAHLAQLRQAKAPETQLRVVERFLDRSHARYLSAIRQMANVRKLLRPALSPLDLATATVKETVPFPRLRRTSENAEAVLN
jgi:hypothetical protein